MEFELRKLCAKDIAPMTVIITKIGWKEFGNVFSAESIERFVGKVKKGDEINEDSVGVMVAFDIAGIILANYNKCEKDIFKLLADLTGQKPNDIANATLTDFAELVLAVIRSEEFSDFFGLATKFLK